jgi:phosphoglycolate phosphatase (TIGR01487 family)
MVIFISIKAIAVDVDGTLTDSKRRLCTSSLESIKKAEKNNIPVIIVTGNILCFTKALSILLGTSGGIVAENGGVIEYNKHISVLGDIRKSEKAYKVLSDKYPIEKVLYSSERLSEIALYRTLSVDIVKDLLRSMEIEVYDSRFALHLTDPEVNKGKSLLSVAEKMGLDSEEIMGIGDSENDLQFLDEVGFKVAVANADFELKNKADYITQRPHGDGVKEAIERFVL